MSIQNLMTHFCDIERDAQTIRGDYNVSKPASWQSHKKDVPCRLIPQVSNVRGIGGAVGEESSISLRDAVKRVVRLIFPRNTDITEADRIVNVRFRNGATLEPGPINVVLIRPADTRSRHHMNVIAERIF
ncbi:hypothetical protein LCGC14_0648130 [marine sediment metagenome]|uniref:Uncharacterized protein n=1 Tax=marine sediment metagenome TaxID=412755 RepID=A0A0F9QX70_9ZZZZ